MNKFVFFALVATTAIANPALAAADEGTYVGAGVTNGNFNGSDDAEGIGFSGVGATTFAGYNMPLGDLFVGVEGNFDVSSADLGTKVRGIEVLYGYGVAARLGYHLSETAAVYGRFGFNRTHVNDFVDSVKFTEERNALRYGLGVEANVSSNVALRVEYSHTRNERTTIDDIKAGVDNNQGTVGVVFGF